MADNFGPSISERFRLREYWKTVKKRLGTFLSFCLSIIVIITIGTLKQEKIYESSATISIDVEAPKVVSFEEVISLKTDNYYSNREYFETQCKIIKSRTILKKVMDKLLLWDDEEFKDASDPIKLLMKSINISPVKDTRLVKVEVENRNPEKAALICNTLVDTFVEENIERKIKAAEQAVQWLDKRLESMKSEVEKSEIELTRYKRENDIISVSLEEKQNIEAQKIEDLTSKIIDAEVERINLETRYRKIKELFDNLDEINISNAGIFGSKVIDELKLIYAKLEQEYSNLSARYKSKHPKITRLEAELKAVKEKIKKEVESELNKAEKEYSIARTNELKLKKALEDLKREAIELGEKEIVFSSLEREVQTNRNIYDILLKRLKETAITRFLTVNEVRVIDRGEVPKVPVRPRVALNISLAILIGLVGGVILALFFDYIDNTIKTREEVENLVGIPFLGIIPSYHNKETTSQEEKECYSYYHPKSSLSECCRTIRTNLTFISPDKPLRKILITSAAPKEGKTTAVVNVGIAMAMGGFKTLLIDTDLRRPRLHKIFSLDNSGGITTSILGETKIEDVIKTTNIPNLFVLTSGPIPPNPAELLGTKKAKDVIEYASDNFERVIFDSPPVAAVTDALVMSKYMDGIVLVIESFKVGLDLILQSKKQLLDVGANIIGGILNNFDLSRKSYGYYYYYHYYNSDTGERIKKRKKKRRKITEIFNY